MKKVATQACPLDQLLLLPLLQAEMKQSRPSTSDAFVQR
jgi:hypothetical protein